MDLQAEKLHEALAGKRKPITDATHSRIEWSVLGVPQEWLPLPEPEPELEEWPPEPEPKPEPEPPCEPLVPDPGPLLDLLLESEIRPPVKSKNTTPTPVGRPDVAVPRIVADKGKIVACMMVDADMLDRIDHWLGSKVFIKDHGCLATDKRIFHAINACRTALIK